MTLRIDTTVEDDVVTLRLSGRISSGGLDDVRNEMTPRRGTIVLDLEEVTLVDIDVVRFLNVAERQGVQLLHCPPFVREWMRRE